MLQPIHNTRLIIIALPFEHDEKAFRGFYAYSSTINSILAQQSHYCACLGSNQNINIYKQLEMSKQYTKLFVLPNLIVPIPAQKRHFLNDKAFHSDNTKPTTVQSDNHNRPVHSAHTQI